MCTRSVESKCAALLAALAVLGMPNCAGAQGYPVRFDFGGPASWPKARRACPTALFNRGGLTMQADAQSRRTQRAIASFAVGPVTMGKPKIVGGDDNVLQSAGSWRSRKKRKNSTPSRSRRRNVSGLLTISPAIAAIFGARK
jgi:hypothetical protein